MTTKLDVLDTVDKTLHWLEKTLGVGTRPNMHVENKFPFAGGFSILGSGFAHSSLQPPEDLPVDHTNAFTRATDINETNFWLMREFGRLEAGVYRLPPVIRRIQALVPLDVSGKYWWHCPHVSLTDPEKIAYTPSHAYGLRDRQVTLRVGKYLKKYYGDHLTDDQIRDLVNNGYGRTIQWAYGGEEMLRVYRNGPHSCMAGKDVVRAYGYQYPNGDLEFGLAFIEHGGKISARAMVALKHKVFVRHYGDEGPILQSVLEDQGFRKCSSMDSMTTRLLHMPVNSSNPYLGCIYMPYLDGEERTVSGPYRDEAGTEFWEWGSDIDKGALRYLWAEYPDGQIGYLANADQSDEDEPEDDDDYMTCDCCDGRFHQDDMNYSQYHDEHICDGCRDDDYIYAYYGRHDDQTYVHQDQTIYCESDSAYYLDDVRVLNYHDVVQLSNGDYGKRDQCFKTIAYEWVSDIDDMIKAGEDDDGNTVWCDESEIDENWIGYKNRRNDSITWCHPDYATSSQCKSISELLLEGYRSEIEDFFGAEQLQDWIDDGLVEFTELAVPVTQQVLLMEEAHA